MRPDVKILKYTLPSGFIVDLPDVNGWLYLDIDNLQHCEDLIVDNQFVFNMIKYKDLDNNLYNLNIGILDTLLYLVTKYPLISSNESSVVDSSNNTINGIVLNNVITRISNNVNSDVLVIEMDLFSLLRGDKSLTLHRLTMKFNLDDNPITNGKCSITFKKLKGDYTVTIDSKEPNDYETTGLYVNTILNKIYYWDGSKYVEITGGGGDKPSVIIDLVIPDSPEEASNSSVPSTKAASTAIKKIRDNLNSYINTNNANINSINNSLNSINTSVSNKIDRSEKGSYNGVASLDSNGKVPNYQLYPVSVPVQSVAGKTGDVVLNKSDVGLSNVDNTPDNSKPISNATQTALNTKVDKVNGKQLSTEDFTTALKTKLENISDSGTSVDKEYVDAQLAKKYNKTGGLISGNVEVQDDVLVHKKVVVLDEVVSYTLDGVEIRSSSGGASILNDLLDVTITNPITGDYLKFNGSVWENGNISYNDISDKPLTFPPSAHTHTIGDVSNLQSSLDLKLDKSIWDANILAIPELMEFLKSTKTRGNAQITGNMIVNGEAVTYALDGVEISTPVGSITILNDLDDVTITEPVVKQFLKYDGTKWINSVISYTDVSDLNNILNSKVDKVSGKELSSNDFTSAYKSKIDGIESGAQVNKVTSVAGKTGAVTLVKADVGLANVDNTSDATKPISTATQTALNDKLGKTETAADSGKLGGRAATDYWHKANSNINTVDWDANVGRFYSGVQTFGNDSYINLGVDKGGGAIIKYNVDGDLHLIPRSGYNSVFTRGFVKINEHIQCDTYRGTNGAYLIGFDTTTKIMGVGSQAANAVNIVKFDTNGAERMRIQSDGKVGINQTTDIAATLDVNGSIRGRGNVWAQNPKGINSQGSFIELGKYKGCLPNYPNDYYPTIRTDYNTLYFSANGKFSAGLYSDDTNSFIYLVNSSNNSEVARIDGRNNSYVNVNGGNFGIGTSTPSYKLQVNGVLGVGDVADTGASRIACFYRSTMTNDSTLYLQLGKTNSAQNCAEIAYNHVSDGNYNNFLSVGCYGASDTNRTYFIANGRVGIGTKTPRAKLDVNGVIRTNEQFIVDSDANTAKMCIQVSNDKSFYLDQNFNLVAKSGCTSTNTWNITNPSGVHMFSINAITGHTVIKNNLIVKGEATTYTLDGVQTTSVGMTREAYVPLSQFEAMEKRLSDQIALLQTEINKLKTN